MDTSKYLTTAEVEVLKPIIQEVREDFLEKCREDTKMASIMCATYFSKRYTFAKVLYFLVGMVILKKEVRKLPYVMRTIMISAHPKKGREAEHAKDVKGMVKFIDESLSIYNEDVIKNTRILASVMNSFGWTPSEEFMNKIDFLYENRQKI